MDLEGLANRLLGKGSCEEEVLKRLKREILTWKGLGEEAAETLARAVLDEVKAAGGEVKDELLSRVLEFPRSGATMHDLGVGCRGEGDFFVHRLIADLAGGDSLIPPEEQDDAGAVEAGGRMIVASVDGTHSRLSDFPFIAGFHVARAAMRDVMVKGARPAALIDDLHLADDGDVGKMFDFVAGISAVSHLTGVPLIAGSTLRVGGDMVIGDRMVSGVGCVGTANRLLKRADVKKGDSIIMTEGAGGGTIATAAIYSGRHEAAEETLNVEFIDAANILLQKNLLKGIHSMLDVTNGGLRGDAREVCETAGVGMSLREEPIRRLVNERVLTLLEELGIDYLGVSLDSLLVFCPPESKGGIISALSEGGVEAAEIGRVTGTGKVLLDGGEFLPRFRESAYTPLKKAVGEGAPSGEEDLKKSAQRAAAKSQRKMKEVIDHVKKNRR